VARDVAMSPFVFVLCCLHDEFCHGVCGEAHYFARAGLQRSFWADAAHVH